MPSVGSDDPRWLFSQPGTVPVRRATPFVTSTSISRRSARGGLRAPFSPRARRTRRAPSRPPASTAPPPGAGSRVSVTWPCMLYRTRWSSPASRAEALAAAVVSCSSARLGREVRADVRRPRVVCRLAAVDLGLGHEPPTVAPAPTACGYGLLAEQVPCQARCGAVGPDFARRRGLRRVGSTADSFAQSGRPGARSPRRWRSPCTCSACCRASSS